MTDPDEPRIAITGDGNVSGDYNTVIVYQGDRPVSVAAWLSPLGPIA